MSHQHTRRAFLRQSATAGVGFWIAGRSALAQAPAGKDKLRIAVIGVAGQGEYNLNNVAGEAIVALCDVDEKLAVEARKRFPQARFYTDFRPVMDRKDIDAVVVATPDHTHATATLAALRAGKHVYCEKPLARTVYEARLVAETAEKTKRVTQMGTQIHAHANYRRVVEIVKAGAIGPVREVHVWVGDHSWVAADRPKDTPPIPEGLHYDLWLGPAPYRPYHPAYLPQRWRGWWDFGGGTLGDMGCHYIDLPKWALDLGHPTTIEAEGPPVHPEGTPAWLIVRYEFPARGPLPPVRLTWYHGDKRPPQVKDGRVPGWGSAVLFVGEKCSLLADYNRHLVLLGPDAKDFKRPDPFIADSIGHHREWIEACRNGGTPTCHFGYAGPLTEMVLLGNVAYRAGRKLEWDARALKATNTPEAEAFIRPVYQNGWTL